MPEVINGSNSLLITPERYENLIESEIRIQIAIDYIMSDVYADIETICILLGKKEVAECIKNKKREEAEKWQKGLNTENEKNNTNTT